VSRAVTVLMMNGAARESSQNLPGSTRTGKRLKPGFLCANGVLNATYRDYRGDRRPEREWRTERW
jgi:hypothetical protein